ncbi:MAG: HIT domain-containing protein [Chloroflexi bacterium]|jgi:ATP adenylyltransferase|nr:HIT domain-containing protein [Chloroflexota bacterium]MBT7081627.1 HIT domain-containing protein [Chloroflexota bacterium]MBT7288957.1 HIT domain-containing protein [Chloroflexota bacterium]
MKELWAPWRMEYILNDADDNGCFLCELPKQTDDAENYILFRGEHNYVILNAFPYNSGHLMVVPYQHGGDMAALSRDTMAEHLEVVSKSLQSLKAAFGAQGFNVGMNIGKVAGAGVTDHLHTHIVPRWEGDTNFMPVIADMKVVPEALSATYNKLKGHF